MSKKLGEMIATPEWGLQELKGRKGKFHLVINCVKPPGYEKTLFVRIFYKEEEDGREHKST